MKRGNYGQHAVLYLLIFLFSPFLILYFCKLSYIYTCFVNTTSCLYTVYNLYSKITVMHGSTDQRMSCFFLFFLSPINVDLPSLFSELFGFSTAVVLLIEQRPSIAFKFSYLSEEELWSMNSSTSKDFLLILSFFRYQKRPAIISSLLPSVISFFSEVKGPCHHTGT